MAIPMHRREFGRESIVLHELAHHLSVAAGIPASPTGTRWHGVEFREAMLYLARVVLGEPEALLLRSWYHSSGVRGG